MSEDGSIFVCFLCEMEFKAVENLTSHMEKHETESPEDILHMKLASKRKKRKRYIWNKSDCTISEKPLIKEEDLDGNTSKAHSLLNQFNIPTRVSEFLKTIPQKPKEDANKAHERAMKIQKYINVKIEKEQELLENQTREPQDNSPSDDFFTFPVEKTEGPTLIKYETLGFCSPADADNNELIDTVNIQVGNDLEIESNSHHFGSKEAFRSKFSNKKSRKGKRGRPEKPQKTYNEEEILKHLHVKNVNRRQAKASNVKYQCRECLKEFTNMFTIKTHMKSHKVLKEIPCPYCDRIFPQRHILYNHLINEHQDESTSLMCPVCSKMFTRPDSLRSHLVRVHEQDGGLMCFVCGKHFPSHGQLEMHVRVHTGERPFKCDMCGRGFVQKAHLHTHLRTMHNVSSADTTPCRICDEKFSGRVSLRLHFERDHGLNNTQYKLIVQRLRKEGKIPETVPPTIKVVDPSYRYKKLDISELPETAGKIVETRTSATEVITEHVMVASTAKSEMYENKKSGISDFQSLDSAGKIIRTESPTNIMSIIKANNAKNKYVRPTTKMRKKAPGSGTLMTGDSASESVMTTPRDIEIKEEVFQSEREMLSPQNSEEVNSTPARDKEELSIVESAFKVAEEMDNLNEGATTIIMTDGDGSSVFYSLPTNEEQTFVDFDQINANGIEQDEQEVSNSEDIILKKVIDSNSIKKRGKVLSNLNNNLNISISQNTATTDPQVVVTDSELSTDSEIIIAESEIAVADSQTVSTDQQIILSESEILGSDSNIIFTPNSQINLTNNSESLVFVTLNDSVSNSITLADSILTTNQILNSDKTEILNNSAKNETSNPKIEILTSDRTEILKSCKTVTLISDQTYTSD